MDTKKFEGHTPGPWEYDATYENVRQANSSRTESNIIAYNVLPHNARLIAAAPDLLAEVTRLRALNAELVGALGGLLWVDEAPGSRKGLDYGDRLAAARAALAKAQD